MEGVLSQYRIYKNKQCNEWLLTALEIGWEEKDLPALKKIFYRHYDCSGYAKENPYFEPKKKVNHGPTRLN